MSTAAILPGALIELQSRPVPAHAEIRPLRVLFIADTHRATNVPDTSVVGDYVDAIAHHSAHALTVVNSRVEHGERCPDLSAFDAVLIHYSILVNLPHFFPPDYRRALRRFEGLKVVVLQDEFRWVDETNRELEALGVHMILSSLSTDNLPRVYRTQGVRHIVKVAALPGYIPARLLARQAPPVPVRALHVTYRGRENPAWFGRAAREKVEIAERFLADAPAEGLRCDISVSEADRVQGDGWIALLASGRATLTVEGGTSIFDFDGEAERRTCEYLARNPNASFDEIAAEVLAPFEGNVIHRTITPRSLEAVCLRTALVGFPGEYRGILQPERHYIVLEKDFRNFASVAERLKDAAFLEALVDRAHAEIAATPDYRFDTFVRRLDGLLQEGAERLVERPKRRGPLHALWRRLAAG